MLSKFIKWGVLAAAGLLTYQAYNWLQQGQWTSITLLSLLEAADFQVPQAQSTSAELVRWPLWAWAILISAIIGVLAVTIDGLDTWWKVRRVKQEFRRLQYDA